MWTILRIKTTQLNFKLRLDVSCLSFFLTLVILAPAKLSAHGEKDTVQFDDLLNVNNVFTLDSTPYSGYAIRQYQGDYKTTRNNGFWEIMDGLLHGSVSNHQGTFEYEHGKLHGVSIVTFNVIHFLTWNFGELETDSIYVPDTLRIKKGARKYYRNGHQKVKDMCGGERRLQSTGFKPNNPNGYYIITFYNKATGATSYQQGAFIEGVKEGKWTHSNSYRGKIREDYFLSGNLYYRKVFDNSDQIIHMEDFLSVNLFGHLGFNSAGKIIKPTKINSINTGVNSDH